MARARARWCGSIGSGYHHDDPRRARGAARARRRPFVVGTTAALLLFSAYGLTSPTVAQAAPCSSSDVRYVPSSNIIYVVGAVSCTLSEIKALLPQAPLVLVNQEHKIWFLKANLKLERGATVALHGSSLGGDVDELRLRSDSSAVIWIRAQWGTLDIAGTRITSWNEVAQQPDSEYATSKRAYIHVRSFLDPDGVTPRESRMDIRDSDIGYLGFPGAEAYGLVWKVIGSGGGLFDKVNVRGNVSFSRIHHNYFGAYTYGALGMEWRNNEIDHNVAYGLDPHDDSDQLVIENNDVHDNGNHGIICSQRCDHLTIRGNQSHHNKGNGIMLHRNTNDSVVEDNQSSHNGDSGVAIFDSHRNVIRGNTLTGNARGIRFSVGSSANRVENNDIADTTTYGLYFYTGSDAPTSGDGRPKKNHVLGNRIRASGTTAVSLKDSDDTTFEKNDFAEGTQTFSLERGRRNRFENNTIPDTVTVLTKGSSSVPGSTIIAGQDRSLVRLDSYSTVTFEDRNNQVFDPEESALATTVTPGVSTLVLKKSQIDDASLVLRRNLLAAVDSDRALVNPTVWEVESDRRKEWSVVTPTGTRTLTYTVGDLVPHTDYAVTKNALPLGTFPTDANGALQFQDATGTTSAATYAVAPALP